MAQKVHIVLVDDLDGSEAEETVTFGLDGVSYEIDLNTANAAKLRDSITPFLGSARRVGGRKGSRKGAGRTDLGPSPKEVRDWARSNGWELSDRGRVPAEVREAFDAAH